MDQVAFLTARAAPRQGAEYDAIARLYDDFRSLWMRIAGQGAEDAMLTDLKAVLRPGMRVLDAGCGTGAIAAGILDAEPDCKLTMLDVSSAMLAKAQGLEADRLLGDVCRLPFRDNVFDLVACAWTIETVDDPFAAVGEMLRVLAESGQLVYTFSAIPGGWLSRTGTALVTSVLNRHFGGKLRPAASSPWHDCERSHRGFFQGGLAVEVALRKCCSIAPQIVPDSAPGRSPG